MSWTEKEALARQARIADLMGCADEDGEDYEPDPIRRPATAPDHVDHFLDSLAARQIAETE